MRHSNTSSAIKKAVKNIAAPFKQAFRHKNKERRLTCQSDTALEDNWVLILSDDMASTSSANLFTNGAFNTIATTFSDNATTLNNTCTINGIAPNNFIVAIGIDRDGSETYIYAANTNNTSGVPTTVMPISNNIGTISAQFSASMPNLEQVSRYRRRFSPLVMSLEELAGTGKQAFPRKKILVREQTSDSILHFDAGHPPFDHDLVQIPVPQFWPGCDNSARFLKLSHRRRWKRHTSVPDATNAHGAAEC